MIQLLRWISNVIGFHSLWQELKHLNCLKALPNVKQECMSFVLIEALFKDIFFVVNFCYLF